MTVLVTGAAGFIGFHVAKRLLEKGEQVIGIDNVTPYYDVALKHARLAQLAPFKNFTFYKADIADKKAIDQIIAGHQDITRIVHLAAQVGVRYSLENPLAYVHSNIAGHVVMLEVARELPKLEHFVYASSSSVYGANSMLPFSVRDEVSTPVSLYGATKISNELMTYSYSHLFHIPATGLRFFTVYGPWGRPDMAMYLFTKAINEGKPIRLFNDGEMKRDFTYIDDIVSALLTCLDTPAQRSSGVPHRVYNVGNHQGEKLTRLIEVMEQAIGKKAIIVKEPMQAGDMKETWADIKETVRDFNFSPTTSIDKGVPAFVEWYLEYTKSKSPSDQQDDTLALVRERLAV